PRARAGADPGGGRRRRRAGRVPRRLRGRGSGGGARRDLEPRRNAMSSPNPLLPRQGQRLLQLGVALFLYSSFEGFAIPRLRSPRIGLSVHTLSALQGAMMLALGLLWPRLR